MATHLLWRLSDRFTSARASGEDGDPRTGYSEATCLVEQLEERRLLSVSGAIWTTLADGSAVNQNLYESKEDVYLNGGPQNQNSAGMTPGDYWVQVTAPNGTILGRSDSPNAVVPASGPGEGRLWFDDPVDGLVHYSLWENLFVWAGGTLSGDTGYADTTNAGGVYKVWAMLHDPAVSFDPAIDAFRPSDSKTDNFKVRQQRPDDPDRDVVLITGYKFEDLNGNGEWDSGEQALANWRINLYDDDDELIDFAYTDSNGYYELTADELIGAASYWVFEDVDASVSDPANWIQTLGAAGHQITSSHFVDGEAGPFNFGNVKLARGIGASTIGYWSNVNGQRELITNPNGLTQKNRFDAGRLTLTADVTAALQEVGLSGDITTNYLALRNWLLGANAKGQEDMTYMLSAQLAAARLNVLVLELDGNAIYNDAALSDLNLAAITHTDGALVNSYGFISFADLFSAARYAITGANTGDREWDFEITKMNQEVLKDILDRFNNDMLSVTMSV